MSKLTALPGQYRIEDLHAQIDEAISKGDSKALLVVFHNDKSEHGAWSANITDGVTSAEVVYLCNQLILLEIAAG